MSKSLYCLFLDLEPSDKLVVINVGSESCAMATFEKLPFLSFDIAMLRSDYQFIFGDMKCLGSFEALHLPSPRTFPLVSCYTSTLILSRCGRQLAGWCRNPEKLVLCLSAG